MFHLSKYALHQRSPAIRRFGSTQCLRHALPGKRSANNWSITCQIAIVNARSHGYGACFPFHGHKLDRPEIAPDAGHEKAPGRASAAGAIRIINFVGLRFVLLPVKQADSAVAVPLVGLAG
jgi:hypothetical protein